MDTNAPCAAVCCTNERENQHLESKHKQDTYALISLYSGSHPHAVCGVQFCPRLILTLIFFSLSVNTVSLP